ncbi:PTS sugar transporter subunit IIC [Thiospirochaeta perfilievii]|uniref:PTS sugar transporter subunit IIC n=1 Tax=Thiospirochaeta perfilievii TaxID=252967 RepID=A0A5C1QBU6_9SPIO|nr:PTS sugar transporter subunit IIC [Thiospirochaeta perfilievii]QEN03672.1 PTS sugar transporter subunit IIC [Thiospirochaeta perfilievii]
MENKINVKEYFIKILTGMSTGIVVALVPFALLGEISKALGFTTILVIIQIGSRLLSAIMGLCIARQFKFSPIQAGTLSITTMIGSGAIKITESGFLLAGLGDVINAGITASIAVALLLLIGNKLKAYTILLVPTIVIIVVGLIGLTTLPYVSRLTGYIGSLVNVFSTLQPVIMGILISVTFAFLIISPVSTVGVALAISLSGLGSGAANLGICSAGFGLAILGFKVNGTGTSLAHFLGSPKMQMANFAKNPKMILPILVNAAVVGVFAGLFNIQGTPMSAGFGISGLIGPINHLSAVGYTVGNVFLTILIFVVAPIVIGIICKYLFITKLNYVEEKDYEIKF